MHLVEPEGSGVDGMESEWTSAVKRFLLNNIGQLDQEDFDAWLDGDLELAELLEPFLKVMAQHRNQVLRELHQISPAEVFDIYVTEHPEIKFEDQGRVIVRIGKEMAAMKAILSAA